MNIELDGKTVGGIIAAALLAFSGTGNYVQHGRVQVAEADLQAALDKANDVGQQCTVALMELQKRAIAQGDVLVATERALRMCRGEVPMNEVVPAPAPTPNSVTP